MPVILYFQTFSGMEIPRKAEMTGHTLDYYKALRVSLCARHLKDVLIVSNTVYFLILLINTYIKEPKQQV